MGAFKSSIPRLLWLYLVGACFLFLIPNTNFQVFAENDADLVFENNLEESKISPDNTHTIERRDTSHGANELNSKSSHLEEEDHWLTTAVKRLKRQLDIRSWFAKDDSREKRDSGEQGQRGQQTDDDEYNDLDNDDEGAVEQLVPESQKHPDISGLLRPDQQTDDEDDFGDISGEGSGIDGKPPVIPGQPIYYRITMTVIEPFVEAFNDRNSRQYRELADNLVRAVDELYEKLEGRQSATVIKIEKREANVFSSKVTMDLGTINNYDHGRIRNHLYSHIRNYHTLGPYEVSDEDFTFREFEGNTRPLPSCQPDELPCHSGGCVPASARCNGVVDCADQSDERGCDYNINEVDLRPELPVPESSDWPPLHGGRPHAETTTSPNLFSTIFGNVFDNNNKGPQPPPYQPPRVETTTPNMFVTIFNELYNKTDRFGGEPEGTTQRPWEPPYIPPEDPYRPPEDPYRPPEDPYRPPEDPYRPPEDPYRPPYEPVETTTPNMFVTLFNELYNKTQGGEPEGTTTESRPWYAPEQPYVPPEQPYHPRPSPGEDTYNTPPPYIPPYEPVETTTKNMFVTLFNELYNKTEFEGPRETTSRPWFPTIVPDRWPEERPYRPPEETPYRPPEERPYRPPEQPLHTTTENMFETIFKDVFGDTTPTPQTSRPTINRCRADDVVRCADGITYICADQQCDGNPDCPHGDDERNCGTGTLLNTHLCY